MRVVLTADETLTSTYRNIPLLDFLGCAPVERVPRIVYSLLDTQVPHENGKLVFAPYGLRKVEAALLRDGFKHTEVVVAHPRHIEKFIDSDTTIVGVNTMDPYGLGPVTMMFTDGGKLTSYTKYKFISLIRKINAIRERKNLKFKLEVGGPGAWQLEFRERVTESLKIDHVVIGETEHVIADIFRDIESESADKFIHVKTWPSLEQIPDIVNPTFKGMVEVMRGCGRGCRFCAPNLRTARYYPVEKIIREIKVNIAAGWNTAWLHSEDIFAYKVEDRRNFYPNEDAIIEVFEKALKMVKYANPTHGSAAGALAAPKILKRIAELNHASINRWVGIQVGLETASPSLIKKIGNNKMKPYSPEEWPWVLLNATYAFNKFFWFPAYTSIVGIPGETEEDEIDTARLIITMEKLLREKLGERAHFTVTPLAFVPMGALKDKDFFDVESQLTPGRVLHIYHAWRHLAWEVDHGLKRVMKSNPAYIIFSPIARFGAHLLVESIRKWAVKRGIDVDKPLEPMDLKIEEIEVK